MLLHVDGAILYFQDNLQHLELNVITQQDLQAFLESTKGETCQMNQGRQMGRREEEERRCYKDKD